MFCEVAALEALHGIPGVVPLIDYGLAPEADGSGGGAFQLVFPRYTCSLAEWRRAQAGGLEPGRVKQYLAIFLQVRRRGGAEGVRLMRCTPGARDARACSTMPFVWWDVGKMVGSGQIGRQFHLCT